MTEAQKDLAIEAQITALRTLAFTFGDDDRALLAWQAAALLKRMRRRETVAKLDAAHLASARS